MTQDSASEIATDEPIIKRAFGMPSVDTFDCIQIGDFVRKYLLKSTVSVDVFARNRRWATYTNDLNPKTCAEYHMDSADFLKMLVHDGVKADLVIFDPPYSPTQMKRAYDGIGLQMDGRDALRCAGWKAERDSIAQLVAPNAMVLSFGWNSNGQGKARGFELAEVLLVAHGAGHNDTICIAERKVIDRQGSLL